MDAVFLKIINMSIAASWVVMAVLVLRLALKKAPKWIHCSLWVLVAVRLLCPFSFESIFSLIPSTDTIPREIIYAREPAIDSGVEIINEALNPVIAGSLAPKGLTSVNPVQVYLFIGGIAWVMGMILMVLYALISYLRLCRRVAPSIVLTENIYLCDYIESPFILGVRKPKIYLPSAMDPNTAAHVLAHERAHIHRRDHWWKPLGFALLTLHWFNPAMWLAYILLCRDIELACDEKVIREMGTDDKKAYSEALLQCSVSRRMIAACPLAFGEVGVKERVKSVLNYKKPAFWIIVVAVIALITAAVCFLTDPMGLNIAELAGIEDMDYESVTLTAGDEANELNAAQKLAVLKFLKGARLEKTPISQNRIERASDYGIILGKTAIYFDSYFSYVWVNDGVKPSFPYLLKDQEEAKDFFSGMLDQEITEPTPTEPFREDERLRKSEHTPTETVREYERLRNMVELVSCTYNYVNMHIRILDGWEFEIDEYDMETETCAIRFRPEGEEGWVSLEYMEQFGVCGLGLTEQETTISDYTVTQGFYDGNPIWSHIFFHDLPGAYVVLNNGADEWLQDSDHHAEVMQMLDTVALAEGILRESELLALVERSISESEYQKIRTSFNQYSGIWTVCLKNEDTNSEVWIDVDQKGNILSSAEVTEAAATEAK